MEKRKREAAVSRKTKETDIRLKLCIDGEGKAEIDTSIPFMDHMLNLMAAHGFFDLEIKARGDTEIDDHHTLEDIGICLGMAFSRALDDRKGIWRYGSAVIPMDDALARVVVDCSNRPYLAYRVPTNLGKTGNFDIRLLKEFLRAFANHSGMTIHVDLLAGEDPHHISEAIFKGFGRALDSALAVENRLQGMIPSTKGLL
ncbi:MAG: imidazoleglycerol-phosphate dehydratase HisB [Deltaproteobacteria bacterium]|nr:imidazoleglycerol-phosphate dehydratase HisB [Deltaproteobacteria bacterium]MBW2018327.1 imidazoleglycerol-phosphate dehydratase HisB [Deltaproteobacteria bacterium]MBW2129935.1 imidazoleglycerol-phosphate dehydratase HisB [Deltaproteobacteria bacterium]